jgi:hypothetical protein
MINLVYSHFIFVRKIFSFFPLTFKLSYTTTKLLANNILQRRKNIRKISKINAQKIYTNYIVVIIVVILNNFPTDNQFS